MAKNMLPNEAIGSVGPVCCWGNIGEYYSPSNEVVAKKDLSCNRFLLQQRAETYDELNDGVEVWNMFIVVWWIVRRQ